MKTLRSPRRTCSTGSRRARPRASTCRHGAHSMDFHQDHHGLSSRTPWTFIKTTMDFLQDHHGLSSRPPWTFFKTTMDFLQEHHGLSSRTPWTFFKNTMDFLQEHHGLLSWLVDFHLVSRVCLE